MKLSRRLFDFLIKKTYIPYKQIHTQYYSLRHQLNRISLKYLDSKLIITLKPNSPFRSPKPLTQRKYTTFLTKKLKSLQFKQITKQLLLHLNIRLQLLLKQIHSLRKRTIITNQNGKLSITVFSHKNIIKQLNQDIASYRSTHSTKKTIRHSLNLAIKHANYITFSSYEKPDWRFEFNTQNGKLRLNLNSIIELTELAIFLQFTGLLSTSGFISNETMYDLKPQNSYPYTYHLELDNPYLIELHANFNRDLKLATDFILNAAKIILHINPKHLNIEFG